MLLHRRPLNVEAVSSRCGQTTQLPGEWFYTSIMYKLVPPKSCVHFQSVVLLQYLKPTAEIRLYMSSHNKNIKRYCSLTFNINLLLKSSLEVSEKKERENYLRNDSTG